VKRTGYLQCVTTFADGEHRALAYSTFVSPQHPMARERPECFRAANPADRSTREEHRRLLLAAQERLQTPAAPGSFLWGVDR
jgi:hypothetical protein